MLNDKIIEKLNDLLSKNYDSEKGYKEAAEEIKEPYLQSFFRENAQKRYDFGHQIKDQIRALGGEITGKGDTVGATVHRAWIDFKSFFTGNDTESILEEVKRGEENALNNYNEVIEDCTTGTPVYEMLTRHRDEIRNMVNRVDTLEEAYDD